MSKLMNRQKRYMYKITEEGIKVLKQPNSWGKKLTTEEVSDVGSLEIHERIQHNPRKSMNLILHALEVYGSQSTPSLSDLTELVYISCYTNLKTLRGLGYIKTDESRIPYIHEITEEGLKVLKQAGNKGKSCL